MLATAHGFTIDGLDAHHVAVQVDVRPGLPAFTIVGLADAAVRESRQRVRAAVRNCGLEFPARRITASLAPGDVPKAGAGLDLALACALLAASGQAPVGELARVAMFGELGLDGEVRACAGALAVAHAARAADIDAIALAPGDAAEAGLVDGIEVIAVERLASVLRVLRGGAGDRPAGRARTTARAATRAEPGGELSDVTGQQHAVRAMVIAAAGAHNILLSGPPGTGKTMLARRMPSLLPRLTRPHALELARVRSLAGETVDRLPLEPPFRSPHHSVTPAGLIGGVTRGAVGEVARAHGGVLFLDELSEFPRSTLDALRQPLEEGRVVLARGGRAVVHPARFLLVAATNPCPCGHAGEPERCACSRTELERHRRRLSGPLLDRIDIAVALEPGHTAAGPHLSSREARVMVERARRMQAERAGRELAPNGQLDHSTLLESAGARGDALEMLGAARERLALSARGEHRTLALARTIADLDGSVTVRARDVGAALALRPSWVAAASGA